MLLMKYTISGTSQAHYALLSHTVLMSDLNLCGLMAPEKMAKSILQRNLIIQFPNDPDILYPSRFSDHSMRSYMMFS